MNFIKKSRASVVRIDMLGVDGVAHNSTAIESRLEFIFETLSICSLLSRAVKKIKQNV